MRRPAWARAPRRRDHFEKLFGRSVDRELALKIARTVRAECYLRERGYKVDGVMLRFVSVGDVGSRAAFYRLLRAGRYLLARTA